MMVNTNLEIADLIKIVASLRIYAGKLAEYGSSEDSAAFRAIADRVVDEVQRSVGERIP